MTSETLGRPAPAPQGVREVVREGSRRRAHLDVWCEKSDGTITVIGSASAIETNA